MQHDALELEQLLGRLTDAHARLAELVEQQRRELKRANPDDIAAAGGRIESQLREIATLESNRRAVAARLAARIGLSSEQATRIRVSELSARLGGEIGRRLQRAAERLAAQLERVGRAGRVNESVTRRMTHFFGELIGQISRVGRDTGCYDARGRRAVARESMGINCLSVVG